ncbi:hypothetical protein [Bifidobacterium adolescentis]|uniref:hypothetical protein n=1 Tax=Bifidobacterium adolescentis TaxID=1680 RepID=UPI00398CAF4E
MTIELVDGKAGVAHISSEDKAIIHQAKFSKSDVVFDWGDAFKCSMSSPNRATIGTGCASIQGLDWHITAAESVTISNGSQGMKRNDIIAAHYHRDSKTGDELVNLTVLKGTPNATTAADPTIPSGKILSGAVDAYMPLWRIPLDGITVGTPVRLFTPKGALWDSVTRDPSRDSTVTVNGWTVTRQHLSGNWYHIKAQRTFTSKTGAFTRALTVPWSVPVEQSMPCIGSVGSTTVAYGTATYSGAVLSVSFAGYGAAVTVIAAGNIMLPD